jgi:hypothetical protein
MTDVILSLDGQERQHFTITGDHDLTGKTAQISFSSPNAQGPDAPFQDATVLSVTHVPAVAGMPESWVLLAEVLLGADGIELQPGDYKVFGKVLDSLERPIHSMGYLRVS